MSVKEKWKTFGKSTGQAFTNFGKSVATTAKVVVGKESNVNDEGKSTLKESWKKTGKGFGTAGKSLGKAASGTAKKVVGEDDEVVTETKEEPEVVEIEVVDKK